MSAVPPLTLAALLKSDSADLDGTVKILAVTAGYVYAATHDFLNDVTAGFRLGTAATLSAKTFTAGVFVNTVSVSYTGVANGAIIAGFVGYIDSGAEATSRIMWFEDKNADGTPINHTADGNPITLSWPLGYIFSI